MSSDHKIWRVRQGPKIFGPMTKAQVEELISAQRVTENDLVSANGETWITVSKWMASQREVETRRWAPLVPRPTLPMRPPQPPPVMTERPPVPIPIAKWTYTRHGQPAGQASEQELRALLESGQLMPADLIWQDGMSAPVLAASVVRYTPPQPRRTHRKRGQATFTLAWIVAIALGMALAALAVGTLWYFSLWPFKAPSISD